MAEANARRPDPALDPEFDLSTLMGRVRKMFQVTSMATLFTTDAELDDARATLKSYRAGDKTVGAPAAYAANAALAAVLHPDTGEKIFPVFRMSCQVPVNLVLFYAMMNAGTLPAIAFWQTVNQSFNVGVNYANRNASTSLTNAEIATTFGAAVVGSVGVSLGIRQIVLRAGALNPVTTALIGFGGVASAHLINVTAMRGVEITDGVDVLDPADMSVVGQSGQAGRRGVGLTIFSRVSLAAAVMTIPPLVLKKLPLPPRARLPVELGLIAGLIWGVMPFSLGAFPQMYEIDADSLEPEFHGRTSKATGRPLTTLVYNKGL